MFICIYRMYKIKYHTLQIIHQLINANILFLTHILTNNQKKTTSVILMYFVYTFSSFIQFYSFFSSFSKVWQKYLYANFCILRGITVLKRKTKTQQKWLAVGWGVGFSESRWTGSSNQLVKQHVSFWRDSLVCSTTVDPETKQKLQWNPEN